MGDMGGGGKCVAMARPCAKSAYCANHASAFGSRPAIGARSGVVARKLARERVSALLAQAYDLPATRARSRLNRVGKTERLKVKKVRGAVKANRGKPRASDW